jgi:hypothetical protein
MIAFPSVRNSLSIVLQNGMQCLHVLAAMFILGGAAVRATSAAHSAPAEAVVAIPLTTAIFHQDIRARELFEAALEIARNAATLPAQVVLGDDRVTARDVFGSGKLLEQLHALSAAVEPENRFVLGFIQEIQRDRLSRSDGLAPAMGNDSAWDAEGQRHFLVAGRCFGLRTGSQNYVICPSYYSVEGIDGVIQGPQPRDVDYVLPRFHDYLLGFDLESGNLALWGSCLYFSKQPNLGLSAALLLSEAVDEAISFTIGDPDVVLTDEVRSDVTARLRGLQWSYEEQEAHDDPRKWHRLDLAKGTCVSESPLKTIQSMQERQLEPVMEDHLDSRGIVRKVQIKAPVSGQSMWYIRGIHLCDCTRDEWKDSLRRYE